MLRKIWNKFGWWWLPFLFFGIMTIVGWSGMAIYFVRDHQPELYVLLNPIPSDSDSETVASLRSLNGAEVVPLGYRQVDSYKWMLTGYVSKSDLAYDYSASLEGGYQVTVHKNGSFEITKAGSLKYKSSRIYADRVYTMKSSPPPDNVSKWDIWHIVDDGDRVRVLKAVWCGSPTKETVNHPTLGLVEYDAPGCDMFDPSDALAHGYAKMPLMRAKVGILENGETVLRVDNFLFRFEDGGAPALLQSRLEFAKEGQPEWADLEARFKTVYRITYDGKTESWDIAWYNPTIIWLDGQVVYVNPKFASQ